MTIIMHNTLMGKYEPPNTKWLVVIIIAGLIIGIGIILYLIT